jgi:hypothetical protein
MPFLCLQPVWVMLVAGGGAGVMSWFFATPIDVVKSVIQVSTAVNI